MSDRANRQPSRRTARDRSTTLLIVGTLLIMPPIAVIFLIDGKFAGLPIPLLYVFVVWVLLIAGAAALARPLRESAYSDVSPRIAKPED